MTPWALISPARLAGSGLLRTQSDARLVDLVRAGNDRAFEAIVLRYQRSLLRHCRRLLPAGRAEDAVQQALLQAFAAMRADQRELQLGPWLHRIAHNTAIDALRRRDFDWEELDERIDGVEPPDRVLERRVRFRSVVATLASLPERQRRALVLRELEGRSYEEIAEALGVTGAGVRQLLNRARNAVRAGASALVPPALLGRLAGSPAGVRVAELADPPGTSALLAKATAAVAAGAVALLAVSGTPPGDHARLPRADARAEPPARQTAANAGRRSAAGTTAARANIEGPRSASSDRRGGPAGARPASGRNAAGGGPAGERLGQGDGPDAAPRRRHGSDGTGKGGGGAGGDNAPGRSHGAPAPADPPDVDEDDDAAGGDDGLDDDAQVAGTGESSDDDGRDDDGADDNGDDHAVALSGGHVAAGLGGDVDDGDGDGDDDDGDDALD
jgi:RNA polymerase sigma factor (sigma-70 family)